MESVLFSVMFVSSVSHKSLLWIFTPGRSIQVSARSLKKKKTKFTFIVYVCFKFLYFFGRFFPFCVKKYQESKFIMWGERSLRIMMTRPPQSESKRNYYQNLFYYYIFFNCGRYSPGTTISMSTLYFVIL